MYKSIFYCLAIFAARGDAYYTGVLPSTHSTYSTFTGFGKNKQTGFSGGNGHMSGYNHSSSYGGTGGQNSRSSYGGGSGMQVQGGMQV